MPHVVMTGIAAAQMLRDQRLVEDVELNLPSGDTVRFLDICDFELSMRFSGDSPRSI